MKVVTIVGARPQFVKAAVVSRAFARQKEVQEMIIHTGQHYDENMSDIFFEEMNIPKPHYNLKVGGLRHGAMTGRMLEQIEEVLLNEKPDYVLVYGDTNSTLAGALAAKKLDIRVAHVEAGLRSFNIKMPEEVNRILTDRISSILFCPTQNSVQNLENEGFRNFDCEIVRCGDVMYDASLFYKDQAKKPAIDVPSKFILATLHRAESTDNDERLAFLVNLFNEIHQQVPVILPIHPRTRKKIAERGLPIHFIALPPVSYFEMIYLLQHCSLVMTDSGGLQKEAYFFCKKCVTLRDETEWVELLEEKVNFLYKELSPLKETILSMAVTNDFTSQAALYGDGKTGELIVQVLQNRLS